MGWRFCRLCVVEVRIGKWCWWTWYDNRHDTDTVDGKFLYYCGKDRSSNDQWEEEEVWAERAHLFLANWKWWDLISRVLAQLDWGVGLCHWLHKLCSYNGVLACRYWNWWQPIQRAVSCEANKLKMCKLVSSFMGSLEFEVVIYPLVCIPFISATELPYSMPQAVHAYLIRCKIRDEWE